VKYFISYDISSDSRRVKSAKILQQCGVRMQYSLFECDLKEKEVSEIRKKLESIINCKTDSIFFLPLCEACCKKKLFVGAEYTIRRTSFININ